MTYQTRLLVTLGVLALAFLITGYMAVQPLRSQAGAEVDAGLSYQGQLTAPDGSPRNGDHTMRFWLYEQESGGTNLWDSGNMTVAVVDGLFSVVLDVAPEDFSGQALWLEIHVEGETLSPRQPMRAAPYALGLRPGAVVESTSAGQDVFTVRAWATGTALRAAGEDRGIHATGQNFGIYGEGGDGLGRGYGGYFTSTHGAGVFGGTSGNVITFTNSFVPGVWGVSEQGVGVLGQSHASFGVGVRGEVATGYGVFGDSGGTGIFGRGAAFGVHGIGNAPAPGGGYGGYFQSSTGVGVYGRSTAVPAMNNSLPAGVWGYSENGAGVYGESGNFGWAGYFDGHVRIDGTLVISDALFANDKSGYVTDVAQNGSDSELETGDVVIVTGVAPAVVGEIPVPTVALAKTSYDRAVIGVVARDFDPDDLYTEPGGAIAPGGYLKIVTLGAYAAIKVDAQHGEIRPGDLLVSSSTPGHAQAVPLDENAPTGTVIGKALEGWNEGTGLIAVLVNMQ